MVKTTKQNKTRIESWQLPAWWCNGCPFFVRYMPKISDKTWTFSLLWHHIDWPDKVTDLVHTVKFVHPQKTSGLVQDLRTNILYNLCYRQLCVQMPNFNYRGNRGRSGQVSVTQLIWPGEKTASFAYTRAGTYIVWQSSETCRTSEKIGWEISRFSAWENEAFVNHNIADFLCTETRRP